MSAVEQRVRLDAGRETVPATAPFPFQQTRQTFETRSFVVNFHGIGAPPRAYDPGEKPFWVSKRDFETLLDTIVQLRPHRKIAITFDDGNLSDYEIAAPRLHQRGLSATFFIVAGRLDRPGFLSRTQVRELAASGFEIGSHGFEHVDWTRQTKPALARETRDAKMVLEDTIGAVVDTAAIPFGLYDGRVLSALHRCQFRQAFSSDGGPRLLPGWPVPRRSMREGIAVSDVPRMVEDGARPANRLRTEVRLRLKASVRTRHAGGERAR